MKTEVQIIAAEICPIARAEFVKKNGQHYAVLFVPAYSTDNSQIVDNKVKSALGRFYQAINEPHASKLEFVDTP